MRRCLNCHHEGLDPDARICPRCRALLATVERELLPPKTKLRGGAYELDYPLGRGGFGITYRATQVALERLVAVKEFYPSDYASRDRDRNVAVPAGSHDAYQRGLDQFLREGQVLARLDHPGVVKVHDCFQERGTAYLVMALIAGHTLEREMERSPGRKLPPGLVSVITEQVVDALEAVHAAGVYHLDIKPENVLLSAGRAILVDFGAARAKADVRRTRAFTLEYAAPEVMLGEEVGPHSDLFELGMMLHEMLTGDRPPPFLSRIPTDTWRVRGLGAPWAGLLEAALRLEPSERPATVRAWWGGSAASGPATHQVSPSAAGAFPTISAAVARAAPGDRIVVQPGTYEETVILDKELYLAGAGPREAVVLRCSDGNCLLVRGEAVTVAGLTLEGRAALKGKQYAAVDVERGRLLLENCSVTSDSLACVAVRGEEAQPVIRGCTLHRGAEAGLFFLRGAQGTVEDCEIAEQATAGVAVRDESAPTLRRCTIRKSGGVGVLVYQKGRPVLEGCRVEGSGLAGLEVRTGGSPLLRGCTICDGRQAGVLVHQEGAGVLERCTVSDNGGSGVECRSDGNPTVVSCHLRENSGFGVCVYAEGAGTFRNNELSGNGRGAWFLEEGVEVVQEGNREA
jgi:parallel beta-helix repeat protein